MQRSDSLSRIDVTFHFLPLNTIDHEIIFRQDHDHAVQALLASLLKAIDEVGIIGFLGITFLNSGSVYLLP